MVQLDARKKAIYISLPEDSDLSQSNKRKGSTGGALEKSFSIANRSTAYKLATRMFYASGLSFNLATSPYFKKYSEFLATNSIPGYIPPTYNRFRTTLLAQEKANINRKLQPIRDTWKRKGLSICSNGCGVVKDGEYIAKVFIKAIEDVDPENVVQVIIDNAKNMKLVGGDHFNIDESINELVELSIDEPQLEGVFFENEVANLGEDNNMVEIEEDDL
ncbi:hypothetical protein BC332_33804 [Capsicum chinense]|nr:hypothetical protein BC332_33804 [Capsicum chinense]